MVIVISQVIGVVFHLQVTNSMAGVVKSMDSALKSMNLEKVSSSSHHPGGCVHK